MSSWTYRIRWRTKLIGWILSIFVAAAQQWYVISCWSFQAIPHDQQQRLSVQLSTELFVSCCIGWFGWFAMPLSLRLFVCNKSSDPIWYYFVGEWLGRRRQKHTKIHTCAVRTFDLWQMGSSVTRQSADQKCIQWCAMMLRQKSCHRQTHSQNTHAHTLSGSVLVVLVVVLVVEDGKAETTTQPNWPATENKIVQTMYGGPLEVRTPTNASDAKAMGTVDIGSLADVVCCHTTYGCVRCVWWTICSFPLHWLLFPWRRSGFFFVFFMNISWIFITFISCSRRGCLVFYYLRHK